MKLTFLGQNALVLDNGDPDQLVMVDPFITGNPLATVAADDFSPATILLTHAHDDHLGDTVAIARRTGCTVVATFELGTWLQLQGLENAIDANHGGTVAFPGGTVKLTPAWHTSSHTDAFLAPGVPAGLVIRYGGKVVYVAGDTCLFGDMRLIADEGLDAAVLPIGDHYTMGPADAARAVEFLGSPPVVIPCHYDTFPPIRQDPQAFKTKVEATTTSEVRVLAPGESTEL